MSLKHLKTCLCMMLGSALTLWGGEAFAQQKLSGKVIDPAGNPVIGATVVIDGTTKGASTDLDGAFSFDEKAGTPITISYIGYQTVKTTLQPGMTVQLQEDSALLEDVVVVGYGVQKKETLTGAISVVKEEMLKDKGSLSSPLQAMQGQIPGVIITRGSSAPGDESWSMSLRGAISANSSEPLVIIDGVAYESINEMRLLNPSDIESMSFLKDGAAAIYGSRAAGGVVLITTKKGKEGRARVEYSGSFSVKTVGLMPTMMTLDEWADSLIQTLENDNNTGDMWYQFAHLAKEYKGHYIDLNKTADPMNGGFKDVVDFVFDDSSDWLGSLFGNAYSTTHDISVSGGSEKISYRVSFGYLYDGSPLQYGNNNNQRYNLRTNNTFQITDWLKLESAIGYNRQEQVAPTNIGSMLTVTLPWPGLPLFTQDGKPYGWGSGDWNSPAAQAEYGGDNKLSVSAVNISETFKIRATKWLDANINLGYNTSAANRHTVNNSVDYYNYAGDMKIYTKPTSDENYYKQTSSKTDFYSFSGYLNAHHDFGDHSLSATLGGQYEFKDYTYFGVQAKNIQTGLEIVNGSGEITISNKEHYQFAVASLDAIIKAGYTVAGVVTVADKASGRGLKVNESAVKKYAVEHNLPLLQPVSLKDPEFLKALEAWKADLFVVVAFRMLPKEVWSMPKYGTFNLHAALLPQYRGAAPINWAVINGEHFTGVTTFMINEGMDTGHIIFREQCKIEDSDNAGTIHDKLMELGAKTVLDTIEAIFEKKVELRLQKSFIQGSEVLKPAPKLSRELCHIDWDRPAKEICNLIRGLSPYPAAFTELEKDGKTLSLKIFEAEKMTEEALAKLKIASGTADNSPAGTIISDGKEIFAILTSDGAIALKDIQMAGKKRMAAKDFLIGFREPWSYSVTKGTSSEVLDKYKKSLAEANQS